MNATQSDRMTLSYVLIKSCHTVERRMGMLVLAQRDANFLVLLIRPYGLGAITSTL
jgi:hypothetical protein